MVELPFRGALATEALWSPRHLFRDAVGARLDYAFAAGVNADIGLRAAVLLISVVLAIGGTGAYYRSEHRILGRTHP